MAIGAARIFENMCIMSPTYMKKILVVSVAGLALFAGCESQEEGPPKQSEQVQVDNDLGLQGSDDTDMHNCAEGYEWKEVEVNLPGGGSTIEGACIK